MPIELRFQAKTDRGLVRANNEDSFLVREDLGLSVVCDGLGGHAAGEIASSLAVAALGEHLHRESSNPLKLLSEAVEDANRRILKDQQLHSDRLGMGTTLSALWFCFENPSSACIAHIGDSRIYRFRNGLLEQITEDHSPVFRLYKEGALSKDQLRMHPQKNLIERSLGLSTHLLCEFFTIDALPGDLFVLCTDGLSDCLSDSDIARICKDSPWDALANSLVKAALEFGGHDNITVVAARLAEAK